VLAVFVRPIRSMIEDACAVELVKTLVPVTIPGRAALFPLSCERRFRFTKKTQ
jgi:hypothetical protein